MGDDMPDNDATASASSHTSRTHIHPFGVIAPVRSAPDTAYKHTTRLTIIKSTTRQRRSTQRALLKNGLRSQRSEMHIHTTAAMINARSAQMCDGGHLQ